LGWSNIGIWVSPLTAAQHSLHPKREEDGNYH
jgi:hypothetical protein